MNQNSRFVTLWGHSARVGLRLIGTLVLVGLFTLHAVPARAEVADVDPTHKPEITLAPAEAEKLATLQGTVVPRLQSDISPDDTTILVAAAVAGKPNSAFVNIHSGAVTPVTDVFTHYPPLTAARWRDNNTAVYLSFDFKVGPLLVSIARDTSKVMTQTVDVPAPPISMSPDGTRLVLVATTRQQALDIRDSPFKYAVQQSFGRVGPTVFDADRQALQLADQQVTILGMDLRNGEITKLLTLPEGSGVRSVAWSQDSTRFAMVRITVPNIGRQGNLLSEKANQDVLGNLAPSDNPFLQGNVVDMFDFSTGDFRLGFLKAANGNGDSFSRVSWSTDDRTLMVQMQRPARLAGRKNPVYLFPESSYLNFYDSTGALIKTFARPEIAAPTTSAPIFVSPDEVIIDAPVGMSYGLYYYNRVSGEFRAITQEPGTYYQVRASRLSRQIVFNYSSFKQPYEVYRISWEGTGLAALTNFNAESTAVNKIRTDQVTFTLRNGAKRTGYILQPADAPFPPRNTRMVVWQQGGPGGTMTNEWGSIVEQPFNLLPNFGIAVLILPLQGREGFGSALYNALAENRNFGSVDIDENEQVVEQMISRGYTSHKRVGITGCSYGGYFTSQSITRYPNTYAAANTQCTLLDLFNEWQFGYTPVVSYLEGRVPTVDRIEYANDSPVYNAVKIRTPLLIFDGTYDFLPISISGNLHDQVVANGTPAKFLRFKYEGHGLRALNSQVVAAQAQLSWFRQYLQQ